MIFSRGWKEKHVVPGLQYFHECTSAAVTNNVDSTFAQRLSQQVKDGDLDDEAVSPPGELTEEGLAELKAAAVPYREHLHGVLAIEVAKRAKIFHDELSSWSNATTSLPRIADDNDLRTIASCANQLQVGVAQKNARHLPPPPDLPIKPLTDGTPAADVCPLSDTLASSEEALDGMDVSHLRPSRTRTYRIIWRHFDQTLNDANPPLRGLFCMEREGLGSLGSYKP